MIERRSDEMKIDHWKESQADIQEKLEYLKRTSDFNPVNIHWLMQMIEQGRKEKHMTNPTEFINLVRESDKHRYIESIFSMGGCYRFHLILKAVFPTATPLLVGNVDRATGKIRWDHVVTEINGTLYDINGEYLLDKVSKVKPLSQEDVEMVEAWNFSNHNFLAVECPVCDEPIPLQTKKGGSV